MDQEQNLELEPYFIREFKLPDGLDAKTCFRQGVCTKNEDCL